MKDNNRTAMNPFMSIESPKAWGPGSMEMAQSLVEATHIREGMRLLEVGGGSGQIATTRDSGRWVSLGLVVGQKK